ncbi:GrdX family protein [Syntrophomonas zehnderi]|nr:GrdX family protein [Syntrophomonas zehnderi]
MKNIIITNNPLVAEKFEDVYWTDGSVEEILIKIRDLVYQGYELVSHPLASSLRMLFSPYRSVIISTPKQQLNFEHAQIIENSIIKYRNHTSCRKTDDQNRDDYKRIDLLLLEAAFAEQQGMWQ